MKQMNQIGKRIVGVGFALLIAMGIVMLFKAGRTGIQSPTDDFFESKLEREADVLSRRHLSLTDPDDAPKGLRYYAEHGFKLMVDTQTYAKAYVGANLQCTNCHFAAGDTSGGIQGGISLVGVAAKYPAFDMRRGKVLNLSERINSCFIRSMNGTPLPLDSELMLSLVCYLHWISSDIAIYKPIPWLGLQPLTTQTAGDPKRGKAVYQTYCALCHRDDGQGTAHNPPLWGPKSFNTGAGLYQSELLASFIYWNMPYRDSTPVLTESQALDVAAYIISQPRPKFKK